MNPAVASAVASAISATCATGTVTVACLTLRGRRPKVRVQAAIGEPHHGLLRPTPDGIAFSIMVMNVRESDVQINNVYFERRRTAVQRVIRRRVQDLVPPDFWFVEGGGRMPGTIKAHHIEVYGFPAEYVRDVFRWDGAPRYRVAIVYAGRRVARSGWIDVLPADEVSAGGENRDDLDQMSKPEQVSQEVSQDSTSPDGL